MILREVLTFVLVMLSAGLGVADAQVGLDKLAQSTMNFQLVSVSAKASGMGEAYYAFGTGADAIFYNPAAAAEMGEATYNISLNYTQWIADINYYAGALSWNLRNYGTIGISYLAVDYGTINGTSINPAGGYIDDGPVSNVGAYSIGLTYAKYISTQFLAGGNVRFVGQNLGDNTFYDGTTTKNSVTKLVFDLGVKYYTLYNDFRFGMAIRNFSSDITHEVYPEQLPLTFTLGGAIDLLDFADKNHDEGNSLTLAVDFLHPNNYSERLNMGMEYKMLGILALRGGYQTNRDIQSWSAGVGFNSTIGGTVWEVNYSFSKMDVFSNVNRFSLAVTF